MRLLVCGDRHWNDCEYVFKMLARLSGSLATLTIIEGGAAGADTCAREAAVRLGLECETYMADWKQYGKAAGPIRNKQMLEEGQPDLVWAFHDNFDRSKGTKNMVMLANKFGVPYSVYGHSLAEVIPSTWVTVQLPLL